MKFDMKAHDIKIQAKFDFGVCRSKVKGHSLLNMRKKYTSGFRSITLVMLPDLNVI